MLDLTDADVADLAARMQPVLFDGMRNSGLLDAKQYVTTRVLANGTAVTLDGNGKSVDLLGHSVGDTLNFVGGSVTVNADNRRQFDIAAPHGLCYDVTLDPDGASTFTSGDTNRIFSTLAAACSCIDDMIFNGTAPSLVITVWCCPNSNSYGAGTIDPDLNNNFSVVFECAGPSPSYGGITNSVVTFDDVTLGGTNSAALSGWSSVFIGFRNIQMGNVLLSDVGDLQLILDGVNAGNIQAAPGHTGTAANVLDGMTIANGSVVSAISVDTISNGQMIESQVNSVKASRIGTVFCSHLIGGVASTGSGNAFMQASDSVSQITLDDVKVSIGSGSVHESLLYLKLAGVLVSPLDDHAIAVRNCALIGNGGFSGQLSLVVNDSGTDTPVNVIVENNIVAAITGTAIGASGAFTNSVFGPNAPDNLDYSGVTGSGNVFYTSGSVPGGSIVVTGLSAGSGIQINSNVISLGNLTGNWTQAGVFDISTAGNLTVLKHAAIGSGASVGTNSILTLQETFADPSVAVAAMSGNAIVSLTADNTHTLAGLNYNTLATGAHTLSGIVSTVQGVSLVGGGATISDARVFDAAGKLSLTTASTMTKLANFYGRNPTGTNLTVTTLYGLYLENLAKGGTNWAIVSLGGASYLQGAVRVGGTAGAAETAPDSQAILELNGSGLGLLLPRMATASAPSGAADGMLWYDSTTGKFRAREGGTDKNLIATGSTNALLDGANHTDTVAGTVTRGDAIVGNATPKWARLALGASGKFLGSDGTDLLYRGVPRMYVWAPDAAPGITITAGDQQGNIAHSGAYGFTATELYVDAETAPGASGLPITVQYGDTDDLDTVASWTTIATLTLSSQKSDKTATMTNAAVPANRLMRMNVGTIVGTPADATVTLEGTCP